MFAIKFCICMDRALFLFALLCSVVVPKVYAVDFTRVMSNVPTVEYGSIERYSVCMTGESIPFIIDIWLPEGYDAGSRYPVVYMADGQNLFDKNHSFAGVAWEVEQKITQLVTGGKIPGPAIVVGIGNRGARNLREEDYFPEKALDNIPADEWSRTHLPSDFRQTCRGDEYAYFVAHDVKEFVDGRYSTMVEREHTFTMGSSMGALISLYIMCEYPDIVGGAACMSTHWVGSVSSSASNGYTMLDDPVCAAAILKYFGESLPEPGAHILYLDEGDSGWDALYVKYNQQMTTLAEAKGYSQSAGTLMVKYWPESGHNEWFWQQHCSVPLEFLLAAHLSGIDRITVSPTPSATIHTLLGVPVGHYAETLAPGIYCNPGKKFLKR